MGVDSGGEEVRRKAERDLLLRLRDQYLEGARTKADQLALLLCRLAEETAHEVDAALPDRPAMDETEESALVQAIRVAHNMVGSGASYGLPGITRRARPIETALRDLPAQRGARQAVLLDILLDALQLRANIRGAHDGEPGLLADPEESG